MPRYVLRAIRRVAVFEITGEEKTIECENEVQMRLEAAKFANEKFAGDPDMALEIIDDKGKPVPQTQRKDTEYGDWNPSF